jgi:hypothetical protein
MPALTCHFGLLARELSVRDIDAFKNENGRPKPLRRIDLCSSVKC